MREIFEREIFEYAAGLCASELPETAMTALCAAAGDELTRRLRDGVSACEIKELFVAAAGTLALSMYMTAQGKSAATSFKAGNLSVSCAGGGETASPGALRALAETMLAGYINDESFGFVGVMG